MTSFFREGICLLLVGIQKHQQSKSCKPISGFEVIQTFSIFEFVLFLWYVQFPRIAPCWLDLHSNTCLPRPQRILKVLFSFSASYIPHPELADILKINGRLSYLGFLLLLDHMPQFFIMLLVLPYPQKTFIHIFSAFMIYF